VGVRLAVAYGITSKGPCHRSKTKGSNIAISNGILEQQGLISLRQVWINLPEMNRPEGIRMQSGVGLEARYLRLPD